jgi:RNA polymerase sigma-70 factor (ECF subfamily)
MHCCLEHPEKVDDSVGGAAIERHGIVLRACLVENYNRFYSRLLWHLGCPDQARDCLHDAWLRLGEMRISAEVKNPVAYVYRVACNAAIDQRRSNRFWQGGGELNREFHEAVIDQAPGPDVIAEACSKLANVERAILKLPIRHQYILMALRVNGLTRQEVAAVHGISRRRVDVILRQALDYCELQALSAG